ncbi:MAG TPA: hypothetical protein VEH78_06715 [Pseudolabrys sp.]|nr:hypothetical protein [Pseudolabrys sp.]
MTVFMFDIRNVFFAARIVLFAGAALALAACQTDNGSPAAGDPPKAGVASAGPDTTAPKPQAAKPAEPAEEPEPMTHTRAARECWMKTEKGSARENLDKRAEIVNKCIEDKMRAASAPAPKT